MLHTKATVVLTADKAWKAIEDVAVGDLLADAELNPTRVLSIIDGSCDPQMLITIGDTTLFCSDTCLLRSTNGVVAVSSLKCYAQMHPKNIVARVDPLLMGATFDVFAGASVPVTMLFEAGAVSNDGFRTLVTESGTFIINSGVIAVSPFWA
jgi:hypothetical protein